MSTFEQTREQFQQEHFTVVEIDMPVVNGECTISGLPGYGTPLSCDQPSNGTKTYKFTTTSAPLLPESDIFRCIKSINEKPTKLMSGRGLASRGTISITFTDFSDQDPNPLSPAVQEDGVGLGTYFGKLDARQIFENKDVIIKNYRVQSDGTIDLVNGAEARHYIVESFESAKSGEWALKGKDELSKANIGESQWPIPLEGFLRTSINDTDLTFDVDANTTYSSTDTIRIGKELIKISSVSNIGTASATVTTLNRGVDIVYTNFLSKTEKEDHSLGDEVYVCQVSDNQRIDDLLEIICLDIGIDAARIPKADWTAEINEWHPTTRVNTIWIDSMDSVEVLEIILTKYMVDMWFDPVDREIKISAISPWQLSTGALDEGNQIDFNSVSRKKMEQLRVTRAAVVYDKRFLASTDSIENYKKASLFKREELEVEALFGKPKLKRFDNSFLLDKDSADLLVNRTVNRYSNPFEFTFMTQERKLDFSVGDVRDLTTSVNVGFNGLQSSTDRAQVTSIKPIYKGYGREYKITALSYEPVFANNSEVVITGSVSDVNLFIQFAGAPSQPVNITFVFDGATSGSSTNIIPSIKAGAFPTGSKITIILVNDAFLQARGGSGGVGESNFFDEESSSWIILHPPSSGTDGGVAYDAQGVDTDIYFSGATPSSAFPVASGSIKAPSGGGGGFSSVVGDLGGNGGSGGNGGNGGDGVLPGSGGGAGTSNGVSANNGLNGTINGNGSGFGFAGANNNAFGGDSGAGVLDNGATVNFFGSNATNYINGRGDH